MSRLTEEEQRVLRALQGDLPLDKRPFRRLAEEGGLSEARFLELARGLKERGVIRRFGALVTPARAGLEANAMVAWRVPEADVERVGTELGGSPHVSHCYERPPLPGFGYNLYTMVHARDEPERGRILDELAGKAGRRDYAVLATKRELKRSDPVY